ncbi:MAG: hypothetical protein ABIY70_04930 [Capsulimonas sp.]|uniref:hypothetical protein n=1 Tax=Capsulimonas sp. TaxID=2494211 RepID=UPI003263A8F6
MRMHPCLMLAVFAFCLAAPVCHAAPSDKPASAQTDVSAAPATDPAQTSGRRHRRHWRRSHDPGGMKVAAPGRGHSLRWHTVRDANGHRHKQWYYGDTGENVSGPEAGGDGEIARDLDAPMSRSEREEQHARRVKALEHLAQVEERVKRDRLARAQKAKAHFHRVQKELSEKHAAAKQ